MLLFFQLGTFGSLRTLTGFVLTGMWNFASFFLGGFLGYMVLLISLVLILLCLAVADPELLGLAFA